MMYRWGKAVILPDAYVSRNTYYAIRNMYYQPLISRVLTDPAHIHSAGFWALRKLSPGRAICHG